MKFKRSTLKDKRLWFVSFFEHPDSLQTEIVDATEFYEAEDYHQARCPLSLSDL
jgi:peptide methionine sulfoxide reductase MsrA